MLVVLYMATPQVTALLPHALGTSWSSSSAARSSAVVVSMMSSDDPLSRIGRLAKGKIKDIGGGDVPDAVSGGKARIGGAGIGGLLGGPFGLLLGLGAGDTLANRAEAKKEMAKMAAVAVAKTPLAATAAARRRLGEGGRPPLLSRRRRPRPRPLRRL